MISSSPVIWEKILPRRTHMIHNGTAFILNGFFEFCEFFVFKPAVKSIELIGACVSGEGL
jgi:hypothetical protein